MIKANLFSENTHDGRACVCVREREREGWLSSVLNNTLEPSVCAQSESQSIYSSLSPSHSSHALISARCAYQHLGQRSFLHTLSIYCSHTHMAHSHLSRLVKLGSTLDRVCHTLKHTVLVFNFTSQSLFFLTHIIQFSPIALSQSNQGVGKFNIP